MIYIELFVTHMCLAPELILRSCLIRRITIFKSLPVLLERQLEIMKYSEISLNLTPLGPYKFSGLEGIPV